MTSTAKSGITADTSGLVDGTSADASDVLNPITDLLDHAKSGRVAVTAADANVKHLNDALTVGSGLTKSTVNGGADEALNLAVDTAVVATLTGTQTLTNKTLTTPTIASFANAAHDHDDAAGGGQLNASNVFSAGTVPVARLPVMVGDSGSGGTAGLVPAPSAGDAAAGKFLGAGGTWGLPGDFVKIASDVLSSSASSFSLTSIPQTYTHLLLRVCISSNNTASNLLMRLNNDATSGNYDSAVIGGNNEEGWGVANGYLTDGTYWEIQGVAFPVAGQFAITEFMLYRYSTASLDKYMTGRCDSFSNGDDDPFGWNMLIFNGRWKGGAAVNRIDIYPSTAVSINTGSWYMLYGIK